MDDETDNNRHESRTAVLILVNARIGGVETMAKVRNISANGAMIEVPCVVQTGDEVALEIRRIGWVDGRVVWVEPVRCGIRFAESIDPALAKEAFIAPPARLGPAPLRRV